MDTCIAYNIAKTFQFKALRSHTMQRNHTTLYRDMVHVTQQEGQAFIFSFGVIVAWKFSQDEIKALIDELKRFSNEVHREFISDEFTYSAENAQMRIHADHIYLSANEIFEMAAASYGIAQSLKLMEFEMYAQKTIENTSHIPDNISKTGKSQLSRKEIAKMRGKLFLVETDINLNFELLDTPEFFWEFPDLESIYDTTAGYLDIKARVDILNKKLMIIHQLFDMLADEQKHKHSAMLEWIIIWLIALEIIIFFISEL
ncbi:MAG: RMD1 family protein [Deltaproteobacteria bacterium]|nr:RMD1 family protein [Deltaproteobacteria bacterium]